MRDATEFMFANNFDDDGCRLQGSLAMREKLVTSGEIAVITSEGGSSVTRMQPDLELSLRTEMAIFLKP
jgi:hypothetical protein